MITDSGEFVLDAAFERRFINFYRAAGNDMLKAMKMAGFDGSDADAAKVGEELLKRPSVRVFLHMVEPKRFNYTDDDILYEYGSVAFQPMGAFLKVKLNKEGDVVDARLDLADKLRALDKLAEHRGLVGQRRGKKVKDRKQALKQLREHMERTAPGSTAAIMAAADQKVRES